MLYELGGSSLSINIRSSEVIVIAYLQYRRALSVLQNKLKKHVENHKETVKKAKTENKSTSEMQYLADEFNHFYASYEEEIKILKSDYYIAEAWNKSIPLPNSTNPKMWEEVHFRKVLTFDGIKKVRSDLRSNQKEINEIFLPYITILIGLLGAITGLVAVLSK